ncbi:hypothetical protein [uncultured Barnesiella sp.]|uniref:hypothetical protein n=1 Tax=uncultured Barnesiella sp. TaxID=584861 RepID=UPI00260C9877|nr:hypothetical protein [uncultured Barnesiella sp.]
MASFKKLTIGDLAVLRLDRRLVLVIINRSLDENEKLTAYPIVAQVICEDENLPKLLPLLYYNDGYNSKIFDIDGLQFLLNTFKSSKLVSDFIIETLALAKREIDQRDTKLALQLLQSSSNAPFNREENIVSNEQLLSKEGKLLIVEKFFTSQMKQEFYDNMALGLTERESLVKLRRKYPKFFSKILLEFRDKDIYTRV